MTEMYNKKVFCIKTASMFIWQLWNNWNSLNLNWVQFPSSNPDQGKFYFIFFSTIKWNKYKLFIARFYILLYIFAIIRLRGLIICSIPVFSWSMLNFHLSAEIQNGCFFTFFSICLKYLLVLPDPKWPTYQRSKGQISLFA